MKNLLCILMLSFLPLSVFAQEPEKFYVIVDYSQAKIGDIKMNDFVNFKKMEKGDDYFEKVELFNIASFVSSLNKKCILKYDKNKEKCKFVIEIVVLYVDLDDGETTCVINFMKNDRLESFCSFSWECEGGNKGGFEERWRVAFEKMGERTGKKINEMMSAIRE